MKWLRYFFLLVVLVAAGCSSAPAPEQMQEDANPAGEGGDLSQEVVAPPTG